MSVVGNFDLDYWGMLKKSGNKENKMFKLYSVGSDDVRNELDFTRRYLKGLLEKDFSDLIPIRITYSPPATICYFPDGDKIVVKCAADEKYIKEVGVQACIMKKLFGSRQKFLKLVHAGYDQPTKKSSEEITKEHIQKIINRINQMPDVI